MKKRIVSMALAAGIGLSTILSPNINAISAVKDIDGHWGQEDIELLLKNKIVTGYEDGTFRHEKEITRAEFIKMVNNIFENEDMTEIKFKDVKKSDWFYEDINKGVAAGYIQGYEDNKIKPNHPISRQEASKIVALASELNPDGPNKINFKDEKDIDRWAKDYVYSLTSHGFISGYEDNTFKPKKQLTRGETAKILAEVFRKNQDENLDKKDEVVDEVEEIVEEIEALEEKTTEELVVEEPVVEEPVVEEPVVEEPVAPGPAPKPEVNVTENLIVSPTRSSVAQAQQWARNRGAHERFINIAPVYWKYGEMTGINPETLYAQAAKETNFGKYTGSVKPEMNNWAGIKTNNPKGDRTYDHQIFATPEDGVRAHFNHVGIYVGIDPIGEPHPRWYVTSTVGWAGTIRTVEEFSTKWAPSPDYGYSIVRDYMKPLYATQY